MVQSPGENLGLHAGDMKLVWIGVFVIVSLFGYGFTEWDAIEHLLRNKGVGDEGVGLIAFAAGYTLPLTVATGGLVFAYLHGAMSGWHPYLTGFVVVSVLFGAGLLAAELGLGLLPEFDAGLPGGGHPVMRLVMWAVKGYFNTYGSPLMVCSIAIGTAVALQLDVWVRGAIAEVDRNSA